jgi:hypothetical protein
MMNKAGIEVIARSAITILILLLLILALSGMAWSG